MRKKKINKIIYFLVIAIAVIYSLYGDKIQNYFTKENNIQHKEVENVTPVTSEDKLQITFLDVGQADSILIKQNDNYMLIDAGNNEDGQKLVAYFKQLGITKFKYVIGTHAHEDHIGGMDDIISNFAIDTFYMPNAITTTKTFEDVLDALEAKRISFQTPVIDSHFNFGECDFETLYTGTDKKDLNDTSIVLKLTYKNVKILFMGDATSKVEKNILNKDIESDVLKVGHHGSRYSSSASFVKKVNPKYAIISVGKNNTYKHPQNITLQKLNKIKAKIYRTDEEGSIFLTTDGTNIEFKTQETDTNG